MAELGFLRFARLLKNLPEESRLVRKYSPYKDWNWEKEVQVQILHAVDGMATLYANAHRKKGAKPLKVPELIQPDYVKEAKKQSEKARLEQKRAQAEDIKAIFERRNDKVKKLEKVANGKDLLDGAGNTNAVARNIEN